MTMTVQTILHAKIETVSTHVPSEVRALPVPIARSSVMLLDALALTVISVLQKLTADPVSPDINYVFRAFYS